MMGKVLEQLDRAELAIDYNTKVMRVLEVMDKTELDAISYNTKGLMLMETKLEAELNVISYKAFEERTGKCSSSWTRQS